jgi:hypothetical protein
MPDRAIRAACRAAIKAHDWPAAARFLLAWGRNCGVPAQSLGGLAMKISDPEQAMAIAALDRACYGGQAPSHNLAQQVGKALSKDLAVAGGSVRSEREAVLPDLYPLRD